MSGATGRGLGRDPGRLALLSVVVALLVGGCLPAAATAEGRQIGGLYDVFVVIAAGVFLLVYALATFAIIRYRVLRRHDAGEPRQVEGNDLIEAIWTAVPLVIVGGLFVGTLAVLSRTEARAATPAAKITCAASAGVGRSTTRPRASLSAGSGPRAGGRRADRTAGPTFRDQLRRRHPFLLRAPVPLQARRHPQGARTSSRSRWRRRARTTASARSSAGSATQRCRSRCAPSRRRTTRRGWRRSAPAALVGPRLSRGDVPPGRLAMTTGAITVRPVPPAGSALVWLTTTDHKRIGIMYAVAAFAFFMVGGVLALLMRAELAQPGLQVMSVESYDQSFTMHGDRS